MPTGGPGSDVQAPEELAVAPVLDEPVRAGDEQMTVKQGGIPEDRRGADGLDVDRRRAVQLPLGETNGRIRDRAGSCLPNRA